MCQPELLARRRPFDCQCLLTSLRFSASLAFLHDLNLQAIELWDCHGDECCECEYDDKEVCQSVHCLLDLIDFQEALKLLSLKLAMAAGQSWHHVAMTTM